MAVRLFPGLVLCVLLGAAASSAHADALESAIDQLWAALSSDPGKAADVQKLRALFHPEARIYGVSTRSGTPELRIRSVDEFIGQFAEPGPEGFYEREVFRSVDRYEELAHVFSTVESRKVRGAPEPNAIGVNSLQLYRDSDGAWRILTLYYQLEKKDAPIAPRYRSGR